VLRDASEESVDLPELARSLRRAQETLREIETTVLSGVAQSLSETSESLARTTERLESQRPQEWLTPEQAARYLGLPSAGAFERVVARESIPKHYISERLPRYSRRELDAWLNAR
jgi:hypothetical protein